MSIPTFRVGFVVGATPDKWARLWRERFREQPIELVPIEQEAQEHDLRAGHQDMALVRLPIDRDGLHCIPLYDEQQVVVAAQDHLIAAADEISLVDLADEQLVAPHPSGWAPDAEQRPWPQMTPQQAIETVAAGTGVVVVPRSVARRYARKDVLSRPVSELPPTTVGLAWLISNDDQRVQDFIGIVRGRTVNSSRS